MNEGERDGGRDRGAEERRGGSELPPRLNGERGPAGELVRRYLRRPHGASEERAWSRFESAWIAPLPDGRPSARRAAAVVVGVAVLGGLSLLVLRWPPAPGPVAEPIAAIPARAPRPATPPEPEPEPDFVPARAPRAMALGRAARRIEPGRWTIPGETSLELAAGSAARGRLSAAGAPALSLARGRIALAVVPKPRPAPFRLTAGPYVFTVLGTTFSVEHGPDRIQLVVSEGRVAVSRSGRRLATVSGGGSWSSGISPPAEVGAVVAAVPADLPASDGGQGSPGGESGCPDLGAGQPRSARLACLRAQAAGQGLRAQIALFQIGRITQEDLAEPVAALAVFEELRRRFPDSPLRAETDLGIVQLLASTGRYQEALAESAALLGRGSGPERTAELRLLRGNLYREALGDLVRAEREYRQAADQGPGAPRADQAQALFLHAVTLEALGQRAEAADRYRRYLGDGRRPQEREARARLERIEQTSAPAAGSK